MLVHRKPNEGHIKSALNTILDPVKGTGLWDAQRIEGIAIDRGHVTITIAIQPQEAQMFEPLRQQAEEVLSQVKRVKKAQAILTAEKSSQHEEASATVANDVPDTVGQDVMPPQQPMGASAPVQDDDTAPTLKRPQAAITLQESARALDALPYVKHVIVVASGKGGVGKSTVAANLAAAMTRKKLHVGLLDADIYGPSQPLMFGVDDAELQIEDRKFIPVKGHDVDLMSAGFLVPGKAPLVWRGPMVHKALVQMIKDTAWGSAEQPLDVLIIDMPPGTGDVGLTLAKHAVISGAVVVTTPQDIALEDARKGLDMFDKLDIPVLGLVENMSQFCCPNCGHETDIFGSGGAAAEAEKRNVPLLAKLSLFADTRHCADQGQPIVLAQPHHDATAEYLELADSVMRTVFSDI